MIEIDAKFRGKCNKCGSPILPDQKIQWNPVTKLTEHITCFKRSCRFIPNNLNFKQIEIIENNKKYVYDTIRFHEVFTYDNWEKKLLGTYYPKNKNPSKFASDSLTQDLILNKNGDVYATKRLGLAMFQAAYWKFPKFLSIDIVVPVPNYFSDIENSSGVSIAKNLTSRLQTKNPQIKYENALQKLTHVKVHTLPKHERDDFFVKNQVYKLVNHEPILNKTVLLVDDIITTKNTMIRCMSELFKGGASKIHVYCAAQTHYNYF